ncbi:hypothetical protein EXIGLDRAFT_697015 [Exidia glandulosa HHB12029]|uniref:Uncharacterized protein n=1 Tax=Exidia glandulosa HHB12029 TaxID=1314781 RepID=A0A165EZF3_EXIGL|nr:hypothetical protein EXIGLDRAFT_697015 [Exidia glandulosa HHB12029]
MLVRQFEGQVSPLRLLCDSAQDALAALEVRPFAVVSIMRHLALTKSTSQDGQDVTNELRRLAERCDSLSNVHSTRDTAFAAPERTALNTIATVLAEATAALQGPVGAFSSLRRRFGTGRSHGRDGNTRTTRVWNWRKRVEDALHLRDIEAGIIMQNLVFAANGGNITPRTIPLGNEAQALPPGSTTGKAADPMLVLYERLLRHAELSFGQLQELTGNHTEVLRIARMSESEREVTSLSLS